MVVHPAEGWGFQLSNFYGFFFNGIEHIFTFVYKNRNPISFLKFFF